MLQKEPKLESLISPFFSAAMRREEDFQRTKSSINIPLISITFERNTFHKKQFPPEKLCIDPCSPFELGEEGTINHDSQQSFSWKYLKNAKPIVTLEEFKENFSIFTEKQLEKLNWKNVFAAGGKLCSSF